MVQSVERAVSILFAFSAEKTTMTAGEIADAVSLNRTTVHRLLTTLENCGLVQRGQERHTYTLAPRVLGLSNSFLGLSGIQAVSVAPLTELRDSTRETAALHIKNGFTRLVLFQVEALRSLRRTYPQLGEPIPLHIGAPSRAILAFMSAGEASEYLDQLRSFGKWSDRKELERELSEIRERDYAISYQERAKDILSLAAPVFDRTGSAIASVNISGPSSRIDQSQYDPFADLVIKAAARISQALGHMGRSK